MEQYAIPPDRTVVRDALLAAWRTAPVLPVLRTALGEEAVSAARLLERSGLPAFELTTTTRDWERALDELRKWDVYVGVGTVMTTDDAARAVDGGADFLVSPRLAPEVRDLARRRGVPFIEGAFTPTELGTALESGIAKLFPAHVGGPDYLRGVLAVTPTARIVPTGGISLEDLPRWLDAGAVAVGVGAGLVDRIRDDPDAVARMVRR